MKLRILAFAAMAALTIVGCKKDSKNEVDETSVTEQLTQHSDDQSRISADLDALDADVNGAVESTGSFARVNNTLTLPPCDATITFDSTASDRIMIITFTGAVCDSFRTRTGTIYVKQPRQQRWGQQGATLRDSIVNLRITRRADNRSITINGLRTHTNVSGGRIAMMPVGATIVHTLDATMSITFDNNSQRQWQAARKRTYTHPTPNMIVVSVAGNHSEGGVNDIAEWGTNRFGNAFQTRIISPLVMKSDCHFRVGEGKVLHTKLAHSTEVTYGLNMQGQPTGCPGNNPYYFKAVWTGANGNTITVIRPYF